MPDKSCGFSTDGSCSCSSTPGLDRREFLRAAGLTLSGVVLADLSAVAGPFEPSDFEKLVPADKKLSPEWVRSLFARGSRTVYRGKDLEKIGMPVGGICTGQLYLGGDGRLWHWDIFNERVGTGDAHYANPPAPTSPLEQGFALRIASAGGTQVRSLDRAGWSDISFNGEYPIGSVEYRDPGTPVQVKLEAFSPFIPLNPEDSALPATAMRFTVSNPGAAPVEAELAGWLQNAVALRSEAQCAGLRRNRVVNRDGLLFLESSAEPLPEEKRVSPRADIPFEDFEAGNYDRWTVTGTAFGDRPMDKSQMPAYQGNVGAQGNRLVNSHNTRHGEDVGQGDAHVGTLTSKPFAIERDYIGFLIGGGAHKGKTCINLIVGGQVILAATGRNDNRMFPHSFDVRRWAGQTAELQIVDAEKGGWGNIGVDDIVFSDTPRGRSTVLTDQSDFGTMGLGLLPEPSAAGTTSSRDHAFTSVPEGKLPGAVFSRAAADSVEPISKPFGDKLIGALSRKFTLAAGASATVTFVVAWHFPNFKLDGLGQHDGRWYGRKFASALAVASYLNQNFPRLASQTRLWHDTWYDSTLPYWFLDRTLLNASILATNTCYWLGNGRFYAWEGVGCCAGTCTHVWHYAHAVARLFPPLERSLRERVDYGVGFEPSTGRIRFRAEHNDHWAVDGQAGCILRTYREHQMSANDEFLRRLWPRVKKSLEFLMAKDGNDDGVIEGPQHNTLDADWFGQIAWLSSLYLAAVRAGEAMATELGDTGFAQRCQAIFASGRRQIEGRLFNGEYFVQLPDPAHPKTVGSCDGCEIDQVFGQSWAWQVGLGRILEEDQTKKALRSLWKYNFTPDVGPYRKAYKPGRWYALAGEGGLIMCTWPKGEKSRFKESFDFYFNECMTGFEYQAAWHMIAEGMVMEGLAVARMIHDRYHPSRRNPWNEVECGDHYARAMASYGVFLAACGYEHHGPRGYLAFAPRLTPEHFKAAFTVADGWGTYQQAAEPAAFKAQISLKWGQVRLQTLAVVPGENYTPTQASVTIGDQTLPATMKFQKGRAEVTLGSPLELHAGESLEIILS